MKKGFPNKKLLSKNAALLGLRDTTQIQSIQANMSLRCLSDTIVSF